MSTLKVEQRRERGLYWDRAWKLVEGCMKVSPGCENCWSETETVMRSGHPNAKIRDRALIVTATGDSDGAPVKQDCFTGNITMRHDNLDLPLRIKKPTVFAIWNDLFHIDVSCDFINEAYDIMVRCPQHTFLVLTKRAAAMMSYVKYAIIEDSKHTPVWTQRCTDEEGDFTFPSNIYHGVTICNQEEADHKIHYLLHVPGKRFLSIEPMLGPIDLIKIDGVCMVQDDYGLDMQINPKIHQVILGGESGKNARPMHPDWVRTIRDQCEAAGVPFMFKQWGEWVPSACPGYFHYPIQGCPEFQKQAHNDKCKMVKSDGLVSGYVRIGKKKAGRTLDGQIHADLIWDN